MSNRIVVVTGATGGLGPAVVEAFEKQGDTVATISRSGAAFPADLTNPEQAAGVVRQVIDKYGRIDVLVHVLGGFSAGGDVASTSLATWERMLNLNLLTAVHILRSVIPVMVSARKGRIVAVGSRAGVQPSPGVSAYAVSKAALHSLIQTTAAELKDSGVTANVVMPGTIRTETNLSWGTAGEAATWVEPASIAGLIRWLASDEAADVSGALIPVYGRS